MKRSVEGKRNGDPHLVPLPRQAVEILRKLHPLTGHGGLVFHGERSHDRPISDRSAMDVVVECYFLCSSWPGG